MNLLDIVNFGHMGAYTTAIKKKDERNPMNTTAVWKTPVWKKSQVVKCSLLFAHPMSMITSVGKHTQILRRW